MGKPRVQHGKATECSVPNGPSGRGHVVKKGFRHDLMPLAMSLVSVIFIGGIVGYDIYQHPSDPHLVHSATIKISGTGHFESDVGTPFNEYTVHGRVSQGEP